MYCTYKNQNHQVIYITKVHPRLKAPMTIMLALKTINTIAICNQLGKPVA